MILKKNMLEQLNKKCYQKNRTDTEIKYSEFSIISRLRLAYNDFIFGIVVYV